MQLFFVLSSILSLNLPAAADSCDDWFKDSKIVSTASDCEMKCGILQVDMGTFECPGKCSDFCKPQEKCAIDKFWKEKVIEAKPKAWRSESEISKSWTEDEKNKVLENLSHLPDILKTKNFRGFYRMKTSAGLVNPGANFDDQIALFDRAFDGPYSLSRVIAHELAHEYYSNLSQAEKSSYLNAMGWIKAAGGEKYLPRSDGFMRVDAKDSPEEDFAVNIETYLFEPEQLKQVVPRAYQWVGNKFINQLKFKDCKSEKSK